MTVISASVTTDSLLRNAIRVDGVVVAAFGVASIAAAGPLSRSTGLPVAAEYVIGALCIAYGPLAFWFASRRHVRIPGRYIAALNVLTGVGLVALVATGVVPDAATAGALAVAAYTLVIGAVQYVGVRRIA
jgi:hypothetical protein